MKKEDYRIKITKLMIRKSYAELLKEKGDKKITVKDLCEKADINRGTFYSHYKDVDDLQNQLVNQFTSLLEETFVEFLSTVDIENLTTKDFIKGLLKSIYTNKDLCEILIYSGNNQSLIKEILDMAKNLVNNFYTKLFKDKSIEEINFWYNFVAGGAMFVIFEWINTGFKKSIDEFSNELNEIILSTINTLNKKESN
ncbi:MAG: TetR/AcrR family transcriptional regulator C-terminal domain-containing protein [Bacilli bacterium]|nr:TetR/AcrR family transcriptional regulator C-terminal domain-containing protein [Bacilli bacterium]